MDRPDIEGALARADAASPAPWRRAAFPCEDCVLDADGEIVVYDEGRPTRPDSSFIASARADVPALARYALALEGQLAEAHANLGADCGATEVDCSCPICTAVRARREP